MSEKTTESIVGGNKKFLAYRNKLSSLTIPKKGQDLDHKHLMLVGGSAEEAKPFVEDIKGLGFKKSIYVAWPDIDKEPPLKEKIYDSMYDYSYETDLFKNIGHASTANMLNKRRDDKRGAIRLSNYRLYILNNVSSVNNDLLCELVTIIDREKYRQYILIATVQSKEELKKLPETWQDRKLFEIISLDGEGVGIESVKERIKTEDRQQGGRIEQDEKKTTLLDDLLKGIQYQPGDNLFIKKADYWIISYESEPILLEVRGNGGLEYIARLLDNPNKEYQAQHLRDMVDDKSPLDVRDTVTYGQLTDYKENEDASALTQDNTKTSRYGVDVVLTDEAITKCKEELKGLREDLKEAKKNNDLGQKAKIEEEINIIESQMIADCGLRDHPRKFKTTNETARKTISGSVVTRLYKKLEKEHKPLLKHLEKNIKISHTCSYSPEKSINWNVKF